MVNLPSAAAAWAIVGAGVEWSVLQPPQWPTEIIIVAAIAVTENMDFSLGLITFIVIKSFNSFNKR